jgi:hypothetical protein
MRKKTGRRKKMQSRQKFSEFMTLISEMFDRDLSAALTDLYWQALKPFPDEKCVEAFNQILLSVKFFPKPGEILEVLQGSQTYRATLAWLEVIEALSSIGCYQSVEFQDRAIHSTIEAMGGWVELGKITNNEIKWKQKEFENLYAVVSERVKVGFGGGDKPARKASPLPGDQKQLPTRHMKPGLPDKVA